MSAVVCALCGCSEWHSGALQCIDALKDRLDRALEPKHRRGDELLVVRSVPVRVQRALIVYEVETQDESGTWGYWKRVDEYTLSKPKDPT